jgi:hypothetical protein
MIYRSRKGALPQHAVAIPALGWRLRGEPRTPVASRQRLRWAHHLASWTVAATGGGHPAYAGTRVAETLIV